MLNLKVLQVSFLCLKLLLQSAFNLNWNGKINLITITSDKNEERRLYSFLERLSDRARLPSMTEFHVLVGSFTESLTAAPWADINILGLSDSLYFKFIRNTPELVKSSCLYVLDSGYESALA